MKVQSELKEASTQEMTRKLAALLMREQPTLPEIAQRLEISEHIAASMLEQLKKQGIAVSATSEDKYYIEKKFSLLDETVLRQFLSTDVAAVPIYLHWTIASTNLEASKLASKGEKGSFFVLSEQQTKGRGRRGKDWVSPFGANLYCTYKTDFRGSVAGLAGLSLAVGVEVVQALQALTGESEINIKWPNDLYYKGRKLGGILIEVTNTAPNEHSVIVGLGINGVHLDESVGQETAAMEEILPAHITRNNWVAVVLEALHRCLVNFQAKGLQGYVRAWEQYDILKDQAVTIHLGGEAVQGVAVGLASNGELIVAAESGLRNFNAGEVSVRKNHTVD